MSDERLRRLERAEQAGDLSARRAAAELRYRLGLVPRPRLWLSGRVGKGRRVHLVSVKAAWGSLFPLTGCGRDASHLEWTSDPESDRVCSRCLCSIDPSDQAVQQGAGIWEWQLALAINGGAPPYPDWGAHQDEIVSGVEELVLGSLEQQGELKLAQQIREAIQGRTR